jgi:hypothetical protein
MAQVNDLRGIVNNSGFLFQLRVACEVEATKEGHRWEVVAEEVPWLDQQTGKGGYIDLVLGKGIVRMVIECKRVKQGTWVFLLPDGTDATDDDLHARCMWVKGPDKLPLPEPPQGPSFRAGWCDFYPEPPSAIAEFCVVRGTGDDDKPMLERIAGQLIDAVECLAIEEILISINSGPGHRYIYVPMIVTNADLQVCRFSTDEIDLSDGKLADGQFESVPFIRFRKSLTTRLTTNFQPSRLKDAHQDKTRSVIVVSAAHLTSLLERWRFGSEYQPPWGATPGLE